jgi:hypothetical protein
MGMEKPTSGINPSEGQASVHKTQTSLGIPGKEINIPVTGSWNIVTIADKGNMSGIR